MTSPTLAGDLAKVRRDLDEATEHIGVIYGAGWASEDALFGRLAQAIESVTRAVSTLALAVEREARQA